VETNPLHFSRAAMRDALLEAGELEIAVHNSAHDRTSKKARRGEIFGSLKSFGPGKEKTQAGLISSWAERACLDLLRNT